MSAKDKQVGGNHYQALAIQPAEFIHKNGIGFLAGNVIKYVCRYKQKGGIQDLEKAKHYVELLIEAESVPEQVQHRLPEPT
jgi:hypothetical protein